MLGFGKVKEKDRNISVVMENPLTEKEIDAWKKGSELTADQRREVAVQTFLSLTRNGYYGSSFAYNGEKDLGGIGPLIDYFIDHEGFRSRAWKAYLDSENAQTVLGKFKLWVIGSGLKCQTEPIKAILEAAGINITEKEFNRNVEALFNLHCNSVDADYSGMKTLHQLAGTAFLNSKIGGDVLVIQRYIDKQVKIQLVDGTHVQNPIGSSPYIAEAETVGNIIKNGIEIDAKGNHIAYYVRNRGIDNNGTNDITIDLETTRIPARSTSSGLVTAFLVIGLEYRLDNVRGIPLISAVMQTMSEMDGYKEATLSSAKESAKIVMAIEHAIFSDGSDPLESIFKHARGTAVTDHIAVDTLGNQVADKIAVTTGRQAFNLTPGASMKAFNSGKELYFKDFYTILTESVCATVNIPYAVAMSKYDTSYSSSRAAIKDWEHTINVNRKDFVIQFYSKIYAFWLDVSILQGDVIAPGYMEARKSNNRKVLSAYRHARYIGAAVPHIDPVKEVEAQRLLLGDTGSSIPLTTAEAACETLNTGEFSHNIEQYARELGESKDLGIEVIVPVPVVAPVKDKKVKNNPAKKS